MSILVRDLFEVGYGQSLALNALCQTTYEDGGIAFVSRTARNNGISAWVERIPDTEPFPAGLLTVCLRSRNHTLATFVQPHLFYCGYHIYVLRPRRSMEWREKLWWAQCIEANNYRYNFGRQANTSFAELSLPDKIPDWVFDQELPQFRQESEPTDDDELDLHGRRWCSFHLADMFDLQRGRRFIRRDLVSGATPYIRASALNNGISQLVSLQPAFPGGLITVASNGSVGEAFYQPDPFVASDDVVVLHPLQPISAPACLFVCTIIRNEQYRFSYGRKWFTSRMQDHVIRLPANPEGQPDWQFMDRFMRSFPLADIVFPAEETP